MKKILFIVSTLMILMSFSIPVMAAPGNVNVKMGDKSTITDVTKGNTTGSPLSDAESKAKILGGSIYAFIKTLAIIVGLISIATGALGIIFANAGKIKEEAWGVVFKVVLAILLISAAAFIISTALEMGYSFTP